MEVLRTCIYIYIDRYIASYGLYISKLKFDEELLANVSHFSMLPWIPLAMDVNEIICKDFFISMENNLYDSFKTSTTLHTKALTTSDTVNFLLCEDNVSLLGWLMGSLLPNQSSRTTTSILYTTLVTSSTTPSWPSFMRTVRFQWIHILQI
jgi:hypothetical protein